jgi:formyl-CoA transferase
VAWLANVASNYLVSGQVPRRYGNAHPNIVPYQSFRAKDGFFTLGVGNDSQWRRLCQVLDRPDLAHDPRFATNPERIKHREVLILLLQEVFLEQRVEDWLQKMTAAGIPCGPVQTVDQVFADSQVLAREMVWEVPHPTAGQVKLVGTPLKLSATPAALQAHPPLLGEHTEEVLSALLGYSREGIQKFREQGVI